MERTRKSWSGRTLAVLAGSGVSMRVTPRMSSSPHSLLVDANVATPTMTAASARTAISKGDWTISGRCRRNICLESRLRTGSHPRGANSESGGARDAPARWSCMVTGPGVTGRIGSTSQAALEELLCPVQRDDDGRRGAEKEDFMLTHRRRDYGMSSSLVDV